VGGFYYNKRFIVESGRSLFAVSCNFFYTFKDLGYTTIDANCVTTIVFRGFLEDRTRFIRYDVVPAKCPTVVNQSFSANRAKRIYLICRHYCVVRDLGISLGLWVVYGL